MVGAEIVITNVETGHQHVHHHRRREFSAVPNLQPGSYEIKFRTGSPLCFAKGITLTVGPGSILNLTMQWVTVNDQVTVTADAPTVNLANATISGVSSKRPCGVAPQRQVVDRSRYAAARRACFPKQPPINAGDRDEARLGLELTIFRRPPPANNYLLDGVTLTIRERRTGQRARRQSWHGPVADFPY